MGWEEIDRREREKPGKRAETAKSTCYLHWRPVTLIKARNIR